VEKNLKKSMVSVIITTYGRSIFLENAIKSVLCQTYKDFEVIVVDDNAELPEIRCQIKSILQKYPKVKLVLNEKNMGGGLSRNEGIKVAKGELISFLDDDDTYFPERLERCVDAYDKQLDKDYVGLIYHQSQSVDVNGRFLCVNSTVLEKKPLAQLLKESCIAATSQWIVPKRVFFQVGMFEDTPCKQDSTMMLKIIGGGFRVVCVNQVLSNYLVHNQVKISGNPRRNIDGLLFYRNLARKYYAKLSKSEIEASERRFAKDLLVNYSAIDDRNSAIIEYRNYSLNNAKFVEELKGLFIILFGSFRVSFECILRSLLHRVKRLIRKN
jgi:glycosyltransferase involved in cell wall biosynthesis